MQAAQTLAAVLAAVLPAARVMVAKAQTISPHTSRLGRGSDEATSRRLSARRGGAAAGTGWAGVGRCGTPPTRRCTTVQLPAGLGQKPLGGLNRGRGPLRRSSVSRQTGVVSTGGRAPARSERVTVIARRSSRVWPAPRVRPPSSALPLLFPLLRHRHPSRRHQSARPCGRHGCLGLHRPVPQGGDLPQSRGGAT